MKNISRGSVALGDLIKGESSLLTKISTKVFTSSYWHLLFFPLSVIVPAKVKFADAILLFVCKPDDAEVAAGDLFEELEKVNSRHSNWYCNLWFTWELSLRVIVKGRKRLTKSVLGPLADLWKRKSG